MAGNIASYYITLTRCLTALVIMGGQRACPSPGERLPASCSRIVLSSAVWSVKVGTVSSASLRLCPPGPCLPQEIMSYSHTPPTHFQDV